MLTAIRQWVIKTMTKGQTGVITTMPKQQIIEMNTQITAERILRNGINPEDLKTVGQVENVINQIDQPKVIPADSAEGRGITEKLLGKKKAPVFDMEGNKISDGSKIMGGKQVESDAAIKARLDADNKKGIETIKISLVDDSIAKIKSLEPMDAMKEANLVAGKKGRYANLDDNQVKKIMDDTQDHIFERDIPDEDFATGGRVGLKGGSGFLKFLNKFKVKQSGDDLKEFLSKRKFIMDMVGNTEENRKARQLAEIKRAMTDVEGYKFPEIKKEDIEKKIAPILLKDRKLNSDGGRIGLKGGAFLNFIKNMTMNKKSPLQFGKDYLKNVKEKTLRANETGKFMDLPLAEVGIPATSGAFINNQIRKKLENMNEDQKEENLKMFIMELENDEFYDKYPDIKDEMIADYTEKLFGEKKADGGRIGYKVGSVDKMRRLILKAFGAGTAGIAAAKSGIFSGLGKGAGKTVAKEVAQQTTSSMPPPYFFKLAEKIKMMGDDATATTERTIAKTLKSKDGKSTYLLEEDITSGDTIIKKINKEGDEMITDVEIMELKKGEVVMGKNGKPVKTPDEYEEVTESNSRIYKDKFNDPNYEDGIKVDEIIKEVDDKIPSIKYAQGGLAYMLGE